MDSKLSLPPGFRFNPWDRELISLYLKPKVLGEKLACNVVEERQLYGADTNPWEVLDPETHPWIVSQGEKSAYVFVNLTKKAVNSNGNKNGREQFIRKAGCGTWDGQTTRTEIRDHDGSRIGEKRMLSFEINQLSDHQDFTRVGNWRMHEYSLCGIHTNIPNPTNTVLCRIILDSSKNAPIKLRHPSNTATKPQKKVNNVVGAASDLDVSDFDEWMQTLFDDEAVLGIASSLFDDVDEQQPVEEFTTNLGKRKFHADTSYPRIIRLLIMFLLWSTLTEMCHISSSSMSPTLRVGDRIFVEKLRELQSCYQGRKGKPRLFFIYEEDERLLQASNSTAKEIREFLHSVGYHHCTQHGTDAHCTKKD